MKKLLLLIVGLALIAGSFLLLRQVLYPLEHLKEIKENSIQYDIDPSLAASIIRLQTTFDEDADKDAQTEDTDRNLFEITESTAKAWATEIGIDFEPKMLKDPVVNIQLGTWYLGQLTKQTDNIDEVIAGWYDRDTIEHTNTDDETLQQYILKCKKVTEMYRILYKFSLGAE